MKRTTQKFLSILTFFLLVTNVIVAQNFVPFTSGKYTASLKGDMLLIGNNVLNRVQGANTANVPHNVGGNNNDFNMQYTDVDSDPTTFCSSTADLTIPSKTTGCYAIKYAGLYWAGMYKQADITSGRVNRANLNTVKFKLPGAANYSDITGSVIYDSFPLDLSATSKGYASYADVTTLVQGLADANGTYGVANLIAGSTANTSAGWTLFVVYEDPLATAKNITLFDGFSSISSTGGLNIPISGFTTIPVGPVRAKLAFSSLEGDLGLTGDRLRINGTALNTPNRAVNNFFNSSIDFVNVLNNVVPFTTRNLNSSNLLGFDAGIINVNNPGNGVIANGSTTATVRLESSGDAYFYYMNAFAVEIIQPQINLIKTVKDLANTNIGNGNVNLSQQLYYDLEFQNIGNDNATFFTITDVLPVNVDFLPADLILPPGVTYTFNAATNTIVFTIPNSLVTQGGAQYLIRIKVKVVDDCNSLRDACSNEIKNLAFKTYRSFNSGIIVENQQPSASGINACLIPEPGTTNFLVGIDDCNFIRDEILCGSSVVLTAGSGYTNYQWHSGAPPTAANIIPGATNQSYTTTTTGTYSVVNTAPAPCLSIIETINVIDFNGVVPNPIIPFADQVGFCTNLGSDLPKIFLCGTGDVRAIQTNILNATSIIWEKLDETSCAASTIVDCPNTNSSCVWNQVATGPNFDANAAGQYRVQIIFQNGCFRTYYFNVYQNLFTPTEVHQDIICGTNGSITVNGVPTGYEYSLSPTGPWQTTNIFPIATAGNYTVYVRQVGTGVGNCVFTILNIPIIVRNFTVDVIPTQPLCNGGQGSIRVQVNNVEPQYTYQLFLGAVLVNSAGPINSNDYIFSNLPSGTYTVIATTTDGCTNTQTVTLTQPAPLTVTAAVTIPLTCGPGEITIYPVGGTPPYVYEVSTIAGFQTTPQFEILTAGTYNVTVTDFNNCTATTTIVVNQIPAPVFTVSQTNVLCYGSNTGSITFNVSNTNGYSIAYSIDNGGTFTANPSFTGLVAGTYPTIVQYTLGGTICTTIAQNIIITEPATALTASGGVSQLAGCGPVGEGEVRITNPQGGIPPYQYSFNNGVTYGPTNTAFLLPGTYTIYVRDANLCIFPMVVTIDPAPNPPTIIVDNPDFNCNGSATSTVTVNNNGGNFAYTYLLDGVPNTNVPSNIFENVPCGPHVIKVQYQNLNIPTFSNLLFEDFGRGASTTSPGIATAYCFNNQPYPASTPCGNNLSLPPSSCGSRTIEDNQYSVTSAIIPNNCNWHPYRDHTSNATDPTGRFLAVNIGSAAGPYGILYSKTINNVLPNQPVNVELYLANLLRVGVNAADPDFILELVDTGGTVIATQSTGIIDNTVNNWQLKTLTLNPGNNTTLNFVIRSGSILYSGNDAAIDDIRVYQLPIACITEVDFPINIACGQAFTAAVTSSSNATCNGANNGQITIAATNFDAAGFYYSLDGGPFILQATSPLVLTGLSASTHTVLVQYDLTATPCAFPLSQVITQPSVLVTNATIISPATCIVGATLQATATGGTLNYQYQLQDDLGNIIVAYQTNNTFTNIPPGNYIINVRDANGCIDPIDTVLVVPVAPTPTATITSNLCIGTTPTFITVNATSGTAPYQYSLNGGVFGTNNTFTNLPAGTYNIIVRDSFGCTYTVPSLIIAPKLAANVTLTSGLDCTSTPNASVTGTINGGTAPYTYQVVFNGGTPTPTAGTPVVGTAFTYTTANAGNYVFIITDATGCASTTTQITINPLPVLNPPTVTVLTNSKCNGDNNGSISITQNGGQGPYIINVVNTTTSQVFGNVTTGLNAGVYTVTITDANSCTATSTVTITEPAPVFFDIVKTDIQCDISGAGTVAGSILVQNLSGGTQPYEIELTNTEGFVASYTTTTNEDHAFTILQFGIYTVTVVDANGCQLIQNSINMASPPNSLNIDISTATANCATGGTIIVTVTPLVVGGPYYFAIYTGAPYPLYTGGAPYQPADVPGGLSSTFTGLAPGVTYSFIVFDATTNCYYFQTALGPVPTLSTIVATATPNNVTCTGFADGSANLTFSNYSGTSVSYQIFSALTNAPVGVLGTSAGLTGAPVTINNFGTLAPGTYYILLTENNGPFNGCSQTTANFIISESPVFLSLVANVTKNDNCNANAGQITVVASNGTPGYSYQIVTAGGTAPTATTWAGQASNVFNVEGGSYDVYVKDAYNCIQMVNVPLVPTDSNPAITLTLEATTLCNSVDGSYSIRVTRTTGLGIAPYTYSVDGGTFTSYTEDASNSFVIAGLNSGTHTVIISDVNGCTFSQSITILPPVTGTATATIAATANCGVSDGIVTVAASGGSGSYTYSISPNPGAIITLSGNVFSNVPAGVYTVTVTDNTTSCTFTIPVAIAAPAPVTFIANATATTCNGVANGSIVVILGAGNNNPPYSYQITGPVNLTQSSNVFNGLPAGAYTITVTSDRGCTSTLNTTVTEPAAIAVTAAVVSEFGCTTGTNTTNFAAITVSGVTGGTSTYINYEFILGGSIVQSGTSNVYTESNLLGGTYTINVYDNNGCFGTTTATILPFISIATPSVSVTNPITCTTNEEITINVVSTGGIPTLSYQVVGLGNTYSVGPQASPIFTGLGVGNYEVTVTNTDTGCSVKTIHYVFSPNTFNVNVTVSNNVTCFGGTNGSIVVNFIDNDLTPTNDAGPFTYTITDQLGNPVANGTTTSAGPENINNLASGIYQLQATLIGSPFCTVSTNFTITQPAALLQIFANSTPITCVATADDGTISVSALDGWGAPYEFQLELGATIISPWSATSYFTGIAPGTYTASVRDALGCTVSTTIVLAVPTPINATINGTNANLLCFGATNGIITVTGVTGGAGSGYLYSLVNVGTGVTSAPQTSNVFENLGAGTYNVIVSDSFTCSAPTGLITITEPATIVSAQLTATAPTCLIPSTITLSASGGTAPYSYSTTAGGPYTTFTGSVSFTVAPGTYQYYVIDANNCLEIDRSIEVLPVIPVSVQVDTTNAIISCNGGTATITATATNGLGGYIYTLNPSPAGVIENNGVFQNVPAGTYTVAVTSGDCIGNSSSFTITEPTPIVYTSSFTNVTCNGLNNGSITVVATGGTGTIQYSISSNPLVTVNNGTFTNLAPGNYTVAVQDQAGCFLTPISFTITEPASIILAALNIAPELCFEDGTDFTFTLTGGTVTATVGYTVSVNGGALTQTSLTGDFSFLDLPAGTYNFAVTDANGCSNFQFTQIFAPGVDIQPIVVIDPNCTGNIPTNIVTVDVNPAVPLAEFTFSLDGATAASTNVFAPVAPGTHTVVVNHISGCSETITFDVIAYDALVLTLAQTGLNQFTATTIGGAGGNEYILNGQDVGSTSVYTINQTGNYTVTVIDDNGCEDTQTIFMTFYDVTIPNYFTPDGDGINDGWSPIYTEGFPNLVVYIFDRYSRKVVTLKQGDSWDGTYNNKPLPTGDYWYVIKLNGDSDTREFIGNFTLYR